MNFVIKTMTSGEPVARAFEIRSGETRLSATLFHPVGTPRAVVIVNPATGVSQRFYKPFAKWLATEKGLACLTYDYRDFGASKRGEVRHARATMAEWCVHDPVAVRDHVWSLLPGVPIWHLGHSLGGMGLAFQDGVSRLERVITVASGPVHLRDHPWPYRAKAAAFWYGLVPMVTRVLGYTPGRALRIGPNLPSGVYWQWRKWCTTKGSFSSDFGTAMPYPDCSAVRCPVKLVAVSDDELVPATAAWRMMDFYREAQKTQLTLKPETYGLNAIGHIEMFSAENAACWGDIIA